MEEVGFSRLSCEAWTYGCLCEDTEILTDKGWLKHYQLEVGSMVAAYSLEEDNFALQEAREVLKYDYEDTAYRIHSDSTDQLVSRNHRCIVEREGERDFYLAENLSKTECVPFMENLSVRELRQFICDEAENEEVLLSEVSRTFAEKKSDADLSRLPEDFPKTSISRQEGESQLLLTGVQREGSGARVESPCTQGTGSLERRDEAESLGENERSEQSFLEGGGHLQKSEGQLQKPEDKVCSVSSRISKYGEERRICDGAQVESGSKSGPSSHSDRVCPSHQSRCDRQSHRESVAVQKQQRPQAIRSSWPTPSTMATITPQFYRGVMWCVRVPYGAFVARRNGKVFVTGNSGFPKSYNIGTGIDDYLGVESRVTGMIAATGTARKSTNKGGHGATTSNIEGRDFIETKIYSKEPSSEEGMRWKGWGSNLKPAWEPVCIGYKGGDNE